MRKFVTVIILMFLLLTIDYGLLTANAAVPHLLNYQGRLTDSGGAPLNGVYSLTFRIYDAETVGNLLWEETQTGVIIQKGIFSILLGSVTNLDLPFDKPYFLEIKVGNEVMSPRQRITSAGYAIRAENLSPTDNNAKLPVMDGSQLTNLKASNLTDGTVPTARLGSGTANNSTYLRGDQSWATVVAETGIHGQVFTSSGTWTKPTGITSVLVKVIGGGAGYGPDQHTDGGTSSFVGSTTIQATGGSWSGGGIGSGGYISCTGGFGTQSNYAGGWFNQVTYGKGYFTSGGGGYAEGIIAVTGDVTVTVGAGGTGGGIGSGSGTTGLVIVYW